MFVGEGWDRATSNGVGQDPLEQIGPRGVGADTGPERQRRKLNSVKKGDGLDEMGSMNANGICTQWIYQKNKKNNQNFIK